MMHACSARIIQKVIISEVGEKASPKAHGRLAGWVCGGRGGGFNTATPVNSVVRQMKTHQVIRANMALEAAPSVEEKLTSRTI